MTTEAQIIANRRNEQKSTGPQTLPMSLGLATAKRFAKTSALEDLIMQNKPNFLIPKMNANSPLTKDYKNLTPFGPKQNKPNQTQFKNQTNPAALDEPAKRRIISVLVTQSAEQAVYYEQSV